MHGWSEQLLAMTQQSSDTVLALHSTLRAEHGWVKMGDVYNALVYLRDKHSRKLGPAE